MSALSAGKDLLLGSGVGGDRSVRPLEAAARAKNGGILHSGEAVVLGESLKPLDPILKFLIGDDIFISYSRLDGATYAAGLATRLTGLGFSCRLDQWGTESGKDMPQSLRNALRRSAALVLVGTEGAAHSRHVRDEVQELKRRARPIIPIVFEGVRLREDKTPKSGSVVRLAELDAGTLVANTAEALWAEAIEGQPIFCEHNSLLETGEPSAMVLNRIEKTFTFRTKDQRLRISTAAATGLLLLLIGASVWAAVMASRSNKRATAAAELETQAQKRAQEQMAAAKKASDEAARQRQVAAAARVEADHQSRIAADAAKTAERARGIAIGRQASLDAMSSRTKSIALEKGWSDPLQHSALLSIEAARRLSGRGIPAADADRALRDALDLFPRGVQKYAYERDIDAALLSATGKYFITIEEDAAVRIWDSLTHARIGNEIKLEGGRFDRSTLFNAGRTLMIAKRNGRPVVWQLPGGTLKWELREAGLAAYQFSQDGKYIVANVSGSESGGAVNRIVVWDADNGSKVAETAYQGTLHGFALSPDNKRLALSLSPVPRQKGDAAGEANSVQVWQLDPPAAKLLIETEAPRRVVVRFSNEPVFLSHLTFSPGGKLIAASLDYHAVVMDSGSLKELTQIGGPERDPDQVNSMQNVESIDRLAFSRDGKALGLLGDDGDFETWDVLTGREIWQAFDNNARYGGYWEQDYLRIEDGGETRVVDVRTGRDVARVLLKGAQEADFAADGERLLLYDKRHVWIYDSGSAQQVARVWRQGDWRIASRSSDGRFVAARSGSRLAVWDAQEMRETATVDHTCDLMDWAPAISVSARYLSTACWDGTVHIWNTTTGQEVWVMKDMPVLVKDVDDIIQPNVYYMGFTPDDKYFQFEAGDGEKGGLIRVWEVSSRREVARIKSAGGVSQNGFFSADGEMLVVNAGEAATIVETKSGRVLGSLPIESFDGFKFNPDSRLLARTVKGTIEVWEPDTWRVLCTTPRTGDFAVFEFGPGGKTLLFKDQGKGIGVLEIVRGCPSRRLSPDKIVTTAIFAFSPSGRYSATITASSNKKVDEAEVWDLATGLRVAAFREASVWGLAFSPDDSYVAAVGPQGMRVKRLLVGVDRTALEADEPTERAVFSVDGKFLAGVAEDRVNVWETTHWSQVATLPHESKVVSAAFLPGKNSLVTVSEYPAVREWILEEDRLIAHACVALQRNLNANEWRRNFGAEKYRATCPQIPMPGAHASQAKDGKALTVKSGDAAADLNLGLALYNKGDYDAAIAEYKKAIGLKPDSAEAHNNLGVAYDRKGGYDAAIAEYGKALALKPDYADAHINLADAFYNKREYDTAIAEYQKALALKPDDADAHLNLGNALDEKGNHDAAIVEYEKALARKPDDADAHLNLASALYNKGDYDAAIAEYKKAIALKSDFADAYNGVGYALAWTHRYDEAMPYIEKALHIRPDDPNFLDSLGFVLAGKAKYDDAVATYKRALQADPENAVIHLHLGQTLEKLGRSEDATHEFNEAYRLNPHLKTQPE